MKKVFYHKNNKIFYFQINKTYDNYSFFGIGYIWDTLTDSNSTSNYYKSGLVFVFGKYELQLSFIQVEKNKKFI